MCYLCDEREKRSVFLDFAAEKRRRQKEYDDMMWDYQRKKKEMDDLKESLTKKATRDYNKEQSAFNWSVHTKKVATYNTVKDTIKQKWVESDAMKRTTSKDYLG